MRVIDADDIRLASVEKYIQINSSFDAYIYLEDLPKILDAQPTVYDVDKVLEQLEAGLANECVYERDQKVYTEAIRCAIEIVKGGGCDVR